MLFYKAEDSLSFPCTMVLFAISYQMELLHDSLTLKTEARCLLLKLVSVTLHEWWLWLCQKGCKQHFLLPFDPNPCRHSAASILSSAELCGGLRSVQHMAPHRGDMSLTQTHVCTLQCLLSCCLSHLLAHCLQHILLTAYLTLPHLAPPKKHRKKSYL